MKPINIFRELRSWALPALIFGGLYVSGLHTEAIGKVQQLILATGLIRPDTENRTSASAASGEYTFQFKTLDGKSVSLADLKGKVVFMNIWATWCPPCIAEMPGIQRLYTKVDRDKVAFVMLTVDDDPEKAKRFIEKKKYTFPVYSIDGPVPRDFATQAIPSTFVLDKNGKIVARHDGMADYDTDEFREFLDGLVRGNVTK
jgi:thiol-disulfide isomerase/thioredoxin